MGRQHEKEGKVQGEEFLSGLMYLVEENTGILLQGLVRRKRPPEQAGSDCQSVHVLWGKARKCQADGGRKSARVKCSGFSAARTQSFRRNGLPLTRLSVVDGGRRRHNEPPRSCMFFIILYSSRQRTAPTWKFRTGLLPTTLPSQIRRREAENPTSHIPCR